MIEGRVRTLLRLGAPLLLAILELGHPRGAAADLDALVPIAGLWLGLHIVQLPVFPLVAWAVADSMHGLVGTSASVSRWALLVFALSATLMDIVAGIGGGLLAWNAAQASPEQRAIDAQYLRTLLSGPLIGTHLSVVDLVVGSAWLVGLWCSAWALGRGMCSALALGLLAVSGLSLSYGGHAARFGPLAFGCVFLALALSRRIYGVGQRGGRRPPRKRRCRTTRRNPDRANSGRYPIRVRGVGRGGALKTLQMLLKDEDNGASPQVPNSWSLTAGPYPLTVERPGCDAMPCQVCANCASPECSGRHR